MSRTVHLAIETATDRLSVAVGGPGEPAREVMLDGARRHAGALVPLIDGLLGQAGVTAEAIGLVAVSEGPGSFTGLRVGAAVAKAIALTGGIPLHSAPSLLVRAAGVAVPGATVLAVSSALRGELFAGAWHFTAAGAIAVRFAPRALGAADLHRLPPVDLVCGEGPPELLEALARQTARAAIGPPEGLPSASQLLGLVGRDGGAVRIEYPERWEPVYGRPAEAQAQWERRHGRPLPDPAGDAG